MTPVGSQADFFNQLKEREIELARTKDPETSKAAGNAQKPGKRTELQQRILRAFAVMGDMHDQALLAQVHLIERNLGFPEDKLSSPSGVRSRRSELSKPNMDVLDSIAREHQFSTLKAEDGFSALNESYQSLARATLRREGFRSPLWDTGKRETVRGNKVIVWGLAK